jgi:predicted nucleic acid-binding Zn ribbon protein
MRSEAVGVVAARVLKDLGVADAGWLQDLESGWAGTVGPVVAAHSRPGRVVGGEVHIFVDSSVWLSELQRMWKTRILELLRAKFGGDRIRSLRFVIDPGDRP